MILDNLLIYLYEYSTRIKNRNSALNHIHFKQLLSTQSYLIDKYTELSGDVLVSCDEQLAGKGQYARKWDSQPGGIYISCLMDANPTLTLSSLEMGVLLVQFFNKKYQIDLKLKWPNDILTIDGKKCAGILINNPGGEKLIVGIGVNLMAGVDKDEYSTPIGHILKKNIEFSQKEFSLEIYKFLLKNRSSADQVICKWNEYCLHLNQKVRLIDSEQTHLGTFKGIGPMGEALIEQEGTINKFYTGSLVL
jgi:BirA family biotin operon repressor/biotin-[acetyl-CoA-carboxylase] ligase